MKPPNMKNAVIDLASEICSCMNSVRSCNPNIRDIYAICLVAPDDFSSLAVYANTQTHFEESDGRLLDKWYFGQWWSEGMQIDETPLKNSIGTVNDFDQTPETDLGPNWLVAMTNAMKLAEEQNAFNFGGIKPTLFCSMIDSGNAVWIETISLEFLNSADVLHDVAPELRKAQEEWYGSSNGRKQFATAYAKMLKSQ